MASRKEQKEAARAAREEAERREAGVEARARRLKLLGGAVAVAVVIVVVAIVVSSGGGGSKSSDLVLTGDDATALVDTVDGELAGAPQSGMTLGEKSAKVTMTYFGDLQCPVCKTFSEQVLPQVISTYVPSGKMKIVYRSLETASGSNPDASSFENQQIAAYAAGEQGKAWQFIELFYHQQGDEGTGYVTEDYLSGIAGQIKGLDLAKWRSARKQSKLANQVKADATAAGIAGASATPTLVLQGPGGTRTATDFSLEAITSAYDAVK